MAGYSDGFGGAADMFSFFQSAGSKAKAGGPRQIAAKRKKLSKKQRASIMADWTQGGGKIKIKSKGGKGGGPKHRPAGSPRGGQFF